MLRGKVFRRVAAAVVAAFAVASVTAACGSVGEETQGGDKPKDDSKTITIGWIPWDEDIVATHLWKQQLEKKGYKVQLRQLEAGPLYTGMANGEIDFFLDGWLPATHEKYWNQYGDKLKKYGVWYKGKATLEITVPDYVKEVKTIGDLGKHADMFGGQIVGIEGSAGITGTAKQAIKDYNLTGKMNLKVSSTPAMLAALESAYKDKKPIAVTLWRPHWAYNKMGLRDLEDPKGAMGKGEYINTIAREDFEKDFPKVAGWLKDFEMTDKELSSLEQVALDEYKDNPAKGVKVWSEQNKEWVANLTK